MALHMLRTTPAFTMSLRGYDKEEVDEYIDALREGRDTDAESLEEASAAVARLQDEVARLSERASDLESCLRAETPRSIFALGQRLTLILEEAEDAATETVAQAKAEADRLLSEATASAEATLSHAAAEAEAASARAAEITRLAEEQAASITEIAESRAASVNRSADERASTVTRAADAHAAAVTKAADDAARLMEADATRKVETLLAEAEARAASRAREMEEWAERMHLHLRRERDKAAEEFAQVWAQRQADLEDLAARRAEIVASLESMRAALHNTVVLARDTSPTAGENEGNSRELASGGTVISAPQDAVTTPGAPELATPGATSVAEPPSSPSTPAIGSADIHDTGALGTPAPTTDEELATDARPLPAEVHTTTDWTVAPDTVDTTEVEADGVDVEDDAASTDEDATNVFRLVPPEVASDAASDLDTWAASWKLDKD
jgi:cell division septum initiation protein DivIVA